MNTGRTKAPLINFIEVNPRETIDKGHLSKKIGMDKLQPFCRDIQEYEIAEFNGGAKFRNSDTIMARITPCLENGKIAMVNVLDENEVGFGSTEYIVFRAKKGLTIPDFVYYLVSSSIVRNPAIKSMVGSSGRQRVQIDVVKNIEICFPSISEQFKIASILKALDDKIALNNKINNNLEQQQGLCLRIPFVCLQARQHISLSGIRLSRRKPVAAQIYFPELQTLFKHWSNCVFEFLNNSFINRKIKFKRVDITLIKSCLSASATLVVYSFIKRTRR